MLMKNRELIIRLWLIDGVGPATISYVLALPIWSVLLEHMQTPVYGCLEQLCAAGVRRATAQCIVAGLDDSTHYEQELMIWQREAISCCTLVDDAYPLALKAIHAPPPVLLYRGVLPHRDHVLMGVVGSRVADEYGMRALELLVPPLLHAGYGIVSGGALGADSMAHTITLAHQGYTIAVLGSGLLKPYPITNTGLFEQIIARGGCCISIFSSQTPAAASNFPVRNRVIAGLSSGVLVVQAAQKSGALLTAYAARDEGRSVFAVPGAFDHPLSAGCHALIKQGATMIAHPYDWQTEGIINGSQPMPVVQKQLYKPAVSKPEQFMTGSRVLTVSPEDTKILDACRIARTFDDLCIESAHLPEALMNKLFRLQLDGYIEQNQVGMWIAR
jgi:DNA protecting protein DprA